VKKYSYIIRWGLFLSLLFPASLAFSDWTAKDASGLNIVFDAFTNSGKVLPKHVTVDTSGNALGVTGNPLAIQMGAGTNVIGGVRITDQTGSNAAGVTAGRVAVDGSGVTQPVTGTVTANMAVNGVLASSSNSVPIQCVTGCATSDPSIATYSAAGEVNLPGSATDSVVIRGSASKIVKVRFIRLNYHNNTPVTTPVQLIKRTSANSGGGVSTTSAVSHDSTDPVSTALVTQHTGLPSLGTSAGILRYATTSAENTSAIPVQTLEFVLGQRGGKAIVLRNDSEFLAVNEVANSNTSSTILRYSIEWTEE
jgi:hypothetical protein